MDILLPDFSQATFESGQPVDNQYFPLTPGTVLSYQGELYDTEEIVEEVAEEIGEEIAEEITEEFGGVEFDDDGDEIDEQDDDLDELADEIEEEVDEIIERLVDNVVEKLGDQVEEFDPEELAEEITEELTEDVLEELTGEELELGDDEAPDDFGDEIVEAIDDTDGFDLLAVEIADEITEAERDLFATESNQVYVTYGTKDILGVQTTVVRDVAWDEGVLVEDTLDWYAQDTGGNVWYLGELATNYEYDDEGNFIGTNTEGSWEAGVDGALPGYLMPANPQVGDLYYQEFYLGEAEDEAEVISLNESIAIDLDNYDNVLQTREFTNLEPDAFELKYFAPGVGQILAEEGITEPGAEPELSPELIGITEIPNVTLPILSTANFDRSTAIDNPYFSLTPGTLTVYEEDFDSNNDGEERHEVLVTEDTKDILGITARVVSEREFDDDLLTDEKLSYYAQDSQGNVWLLGETITEYEYDEAGNLIETDDSESWLAGEGQALPGLIMSGNATSGEAYYQRFDIGEVESQAEVVETGITLNVDDDSFTDVIKVKEFSALEPNEFDFIYYAPGVGQILEEEIVAGELVFTSELDDTYQIADSYTVDFETSPGGDELIAGTTVTNQYDSLSGLTISTPRDEFGAMIFDSSNPTGEDFDLGTADLGNVLIISEDGDAAHPDDLAGGGTIRFEWSDSVFVDSILVDSIDLLDIDHPGGSIVAYDDDGEVLTTVSIPEFGDNSLGQVEIDTADVAYLDVNLAGSGAIAEVNFSSLTEVESSALV